ncbi:MAG TPA: acyl-CoA dehydrogenase family protein, partial [Flavisolibacter sp.]|nr:acyl-CoA dehydrogenase family protein [Flavisolibacter sp.]
MKAETTYVAPEVLSTNQLSDRIDAIAPLLSRHAEEDEGSRRLSPPVMDALRQAGLFRLFLPKSLGGFEADPITTAKLVEEVARCNTAAGWAMMVANTSLWWSSRLSAKGIEALCRENGPDTFVAGAFHPPMQATPTDEGFRINGRSPLTSNVHEAHWIFVTAFVMENGQPKMHNGLPQIVGVFMRSQDVQIVDTWYTLGMKATDSNDISARDV